MVLFSRGNTFLSTYSRLVNPALSKDFPASVLFLVSHFFIPHLYALFNVNTDRPTLVVVDLAFFPTAHISTPEAFHFPLKL